MSIAKKEEICSNRLVPRLGEPAVGVPIKKRPVSLSDNSVASGIPISMMPLSTAQEMSVPAAGAGFGKERFISFARSDANMVTKGKGITNSQIQDHANRPFTTLSMATSNRVPLNGSTEGPSPESAAPANESQQQKLWSFDLQLPSYQSGGSTVKEEKTEQGFFGFSSTQHPKNVQTVSEANALSSISFGKLPNLDLNVSLDPADSLESLPTIHEKRTGLYQGTIQHQKEQMPVAAPVSTISGGLNQSTNSTLNLSNSSKLSRKSGPGDVTLDLQLKPPARPELGVNWKGLAPAPELSLSLFGKSTTEPKDLSAPNLLFSLEPAGNTKKISEDVAMPGLAKSPVEKIVKPVPPASPVVSGSSNVVPKSLVKKEPEEASQQQSLNRMEKEPMLQQQSVGLVRSSPASKTGFDLNSDIFPNNSIHDALDAVTDSVPTPAETLPDIDRTETLPAVPEVQKYVKCEETGSATPNPAEATANGHSVPSAGAKPSPLEGDSPGPAAGLCESVHQQSISISEPSCSNAFYKPPATHLHSHNVMREEMGTCSNPVAQQLVVNSRDGAVVDGMSQGSAEMDCSDDDGATISQLPTTDKPRVEPSGSGLTTKDGANAKILCTELQKEHDSDTPQNHSSLAKIVNEESKDKPLLNADNDSTQNVKTTACSSSTDPPKPSALQIPTSVKMESTRESPGPSDRFEKTRSPELKSVRSPDGKQASSCSKDHAKIAAVKMEHQTESEDITKQSDLHSRDSVLGEDSDKASSSQANSECGKVKSASEMSEYDKPKPDFCRTSSLQNERAGQFVGYPFVNRNERWERFMESEREKKKGDYHGGRPASEMINQRRTDHRYGGRGGGSHGHHPRNFRGPRRSDESEIAFADEHINGRRRPFEDDLGHSQRVPHRRRGCLMREMDIDGFSGREIPGPRLAARGQIGDLPDDMIEDRFFGPHSHQHHAPGDHGFVRRERSHSPAQRRGAPVHFHRGRSPEAMHRSPSLGRTERPYLHHRRHTRRHGSPLDRVGHDERGMQRNTRRCGIIGSHQALEEDAFEPPLHPAHLAEFHAEEELVHRRRYGERRAYLRSLEEAQVGNEEDMISYHSEDGDMEFAEGDGPRELDGCFRNRFGHRARGEQEDSYRQHRGPPNGSRPKRRRY
ncbi:hypothetical protein EJB05_09440 [Eragrostis curvula]|uniref:Uncharacterized protein n=1 Tax=Eragrostis curvula TaxID=38414 RepID=A0A5J9W6M3_9POAL|nr:hypothetical protein EJB05_09440 [Eragrostis curvula]